MLYTETYKFKPEYKICNKCKEEKLLSNFRILKTGIKNSCKSCEADYKKFWCQANREKIKAQGKIWVLNNKDKVLASSRKHRISNKEKILEKTRQDYAENPEPFRNRSLKWRDANLEQYKAYGKKYRRENPEKILAKTNKRRAGKLNAQPSWVNEFFIQEAYALAKLRTKMFGFPWHVDHIIPLKHPLVCGLHCEFNLQVIPASVNLSKSNKFSIQ